MSKKIMRTAIVIIAACLAAPAYAAPAKQYPPRDECLSVDGYFDLRQKFEDIVKRRDAKALLAMTSPTISWSFGGDASKSQFAAEWKLESGRASPIWAELDKIIRLGCANEDKNVIMPHFFSQKIPDEDQGVGSVALVLGPEVKLRTGPSTTTPIKAIMNWDVVELGEADPNGKWTAVKTTDGKSGYIRNDYLRNRTDYRIAFERSAKGWQITYFIAGD